MAAMNQHTTPHASRKTGRLARRLGIWAFIFFAAKGILWLLVPALMAWLAL